uniref:Uncharacterized protein n=1 Tax=Siphoviridae sp. ctQLz13 TaxID=2825492 RepID=A0A8S5NUQ9_9CAUD|nr:MAG TPA: hypothetical protein [Siphoviridae sp. ctQLz13]DAH28534.1 MAG TPA: hypothetical protein [Caudoviricetes sp.]
MMRYIKIFENNHKIIVNRNAFKNSFVVKMMP